MALPAVRHSLSWREEGSAAAHATPAGGLSAAAAKDDDDEALAAKASSSALVEHFMAWLVVSLGADITVVFVVLGLLQI